MIVGPPKILRILAPQRPLARRFAVIDCRRRSACPFRGSIIEENLMQITLFKALKSVKLSDDQATEVVEAVEEYIAVKINEANKGLEAQLKAQTWLIGSFGLIISIAAVAVAFVKLAH
jgi:hypothetical protein